MLHSIHGNKRARVHVNRLRKSDAMRYDAETQDPRDGMWPDSRRILRGIINVDADKP